MKRVALLALASILLAGAAVAAPRRKSAPDKFARAASEAFLAAVTADQKGDLHSALGLYTKAFGISPHPSTAFNMADLQVRLSLLSAAARSYETYLALAPNAPDRADVERMIDKLLHGPTVLTLTTSPASNPDSVMFKWAYVLVDGVIVKKPGVAPADPDKPRLNFDVVPGQHLIEVITDVTYGKRSCEVKPGERNECMLTAPPRIDGTIVFSGDDSLSLWLTHKDNHSGTPKDQIGKRVTVPAGKRRVILRDRHFECSPFVVEIPGGSDLAYVHVAAKEHDELRRCRTIDIKRLRLTFDP